MIHTLPKPIDRWDITFDEINDIINISTDRYFIYVLVLNDIPVYVGRTSRLRNRLYTHKTYKKFTHVTIFEYNKQDLHIVEKTLVQYFEPVYNWMWNPTKQ
jgi:hypothetical protein